MELTRANKELRESEERYRRLLASVTGYVYTVEVHDGVPVRTTHGTGCESVTGYTSGDYQRDPNLWIGMVYPDDRGLVVDAVGRMFSSLTPLSLEHRIVHKSGEIRWVGATIVPHRSAAGGVTSYDGVVTDITERKRAEELIVRLNEDLERRVSERTTRLNMTIQRLEAEIAERRRVEEQNNLLIKEVHHRVKNNLNVILSLVQQCQLSLKSGPHAATDSVLEDLEARIMGIVLLHNHLYQAGHINIVDMEVYLKGIVDAVAEHYARTDVVLSADVAPAEFNVETAMACGLLANELLTNALKHAFPARGGRVALTLDPLDDEVSWRLTVRDDGRGLPYGFSVAACATMGMQLISSLARQLQARMEIASEVTAGTVFQFDFREIRYANRIHT